MISDETIEELLRQSWGLADGTRVTRHDGSLGSQTWIVEQADGRWVAKSVAPHLAESFACGLQVAQLLEDAGIRSGAPARALSGSTTVDTASGDRVALLTWVPGRPPHRCQRERAAADRGHPRTGSSCPARPQDSGHPALPLG